MGRKVRRTLYIFVFAILLLIIGSAGAYAIATPQIKAHVKLVGCELSSDGEEAECAFRILQKRIESDGIVPAIDTFLTALDMFPTELDYDCHSASHRLGDMVYYSMFFDGSVDLSQQEFPRRSMMCNRAFFHGMFEHMFQDRPDPQFIADTCNRFKQMEDSALHEVTNSCFHAAGHGLFRYYAESVKEKNYGNVDAFINDAVKFCRNLPDTNDHERFVCITGIQSIFIIASIRGEYGFKDPDTTDPYAVCSLFDESIRENCWSVRAIMLGHMDNDYVGALAGCEAANDIFFDRCIRGIIIGVFTNGVSEKSLSRLLEFCKEPAIADRDRVGFCYESLVKQLGIEYRPVPIDCSIFPIEYYSSCEEVIQA